MRILFLFVLLLNGHTVLARSCNQAVGIESGKILDEAFTASSSYNQWHGPHQARLNNFKSSKGEGAWCSKNNTIGDYIQVDLGSVRELSRIGTQGRNTTYFMYVSKYKLRYSTVGIAYTTFPMFVGSLDPKIFNANNDKNSIVYNDMRRNYQPIRARYVRIFPQAFYGKMCLRFELYECIGTHESCFDKNGGCSHQCTESPPGTVVCKCPSGYKLQDDGKTCTDENECAGNHGCNSTCVNTVGSYHCACPQGMKVGSDGKSCIDINECLPGSDPCDPHSTTCVNENGSYKCQCKPGFKPGFGKDSCQDINECDQGIDLCDRTSTICRNRIGYYDCECRAGHNRVSEHKCRDNDECSLDKDDCSHGCVNTIGSFRCTCPTGYVISASNSKQCVDRNECLSVNGGCEWYCKNTVGSYECSCKSGYVLADDKHKCQDVNECSNGADKCDSTSTNCNNYGGGYQCDCKSGYKYIQGNEYKCELRNCPPLVLSEGTVISPLACLQPGAMKVGSTCKFSCHSGYKLPTSKDTLNCLASGRWDAANIGCQRISCPVLTAPANGDLYPKSCKVTGARFQGKCYYSCSQGFTLSGVSTKTCRADSSWDSHQTPTCTRTYAKPWVTCPSSVITTLPPGAREADATLLLGSAKSNYQNSVKIFPSQYSGKLVFPAGKTILYFVASNPIGETANCSISINVMDKEAPKAVSYPSNQYLVTKGKDAVATWDAPKFSDNVGVVRVTSSKNSGYKFPLGSITVYISAFDAAGNGISVSFEVQVKKAECPVAVPPENGKVNCYGIAGGYKYCTVTCDPGKKLFKSTYGMSCDGTSLVWDPLALPDCVDYVAKTNGSCPNGKIPQASALQGYPVENVCVNCPKGMYYKEGSKTCEHCAKGYISTVESSRACSKCPSGSSTMVEGAKTCIALCKPGTSSPTGFDQFSIQKPCHLCHVGRYQDQVGSTTCKTCPTGQTTLTQGAKAVSECGGPPKITLFGPSPVNVTEKNQASFECRASGSPLPVFNITKLKEPPHGYGGARKVEHITEDGKQVGVRFTILRALELDGGVYACRASNPFGYDVGYLQVNVKLNIIHGRRRRMLRKSP